MLGKTLIKLGKNLLVVIIFIFAITKCQNNAVSNQDLSNHKKILKLNTKWINLGDDMGQTDHEMCIAAVESAEFSSDDRYIVSGARKGKNLRIWETSNGNLIFNHKCEEEIEAVKFSPDNRFFVAGGAFNKLLVWRISDWSLHKELEFSSSIEGLSFAHSKKLLAVGDESGKITLLNSENFNILNSVIHSDENYDPFDTLQSDVNSLDFSIDDTYLISGGIDGKLKIWFVPELKLIKTIDAHKSSIKSVRINHEKGCIASASSESYIGSENSIKIWDFNSGDLLHTLTFPFGMEAVEFTPDGKFLFGGGTEGVNGSKNEINQGHIYIYYIPDNVLTQPIRQIHEEPVFRTEYLHVNHKGDKLISSHEDGSIRLWDIIYN